MEAGPETSLRYTRQHKAATRHRLLELGGRHAKKHGFAASGMDALAAAAGVTTGSVYKHFDGKSDLFAAIVENELARSATAFRALSIEDREAVARAFSNYLSSGHVDHPERGCLLPSLTAEVARAGDTVRARFESGVSDIHAVIERRTGSSDEAWALLAQVVGAVMLARAMHGDDAKQRVLSSVQRNCLSVLNRD
jgi:AcrR family transcriptional regulator